MGSNASFSAIGFNPTRTEALVQLKHRCGNQCGSTDAVLLRKNGAGWRVVERMPLRGFEQLTVGELRYMGLDERWRTLRKRAADSTRHAVADSIELDHAPRRIHGTVINRKTGGVISGAQIFVRSHASGRDPWGGCRRCQRAVRGKKPADWWNDAGIAVSGIASPCWRDARRARVLRVSRCRYSARHGSTRHQALLVFS